MPSPDNAPPRLQHLTSFHILLSFSRNCKTLSLCPQTARFPRGFSYSGETNLRRMVILGTSYGNSASLDSSLITGERRDYPPEGRSEHFRDFCQLLTPCTQTECARAPRLCIQVRRTVPRIWCYSGWPDGTSFNSEQPGYPAREALQETICENPCL